jgi:hypothetical protein
MPGEIRSTMRHTHGEAAGVGFEPTNEPSARCRFSRPVQLRAGQLRLAHLEVAHLRSAQISCASVSES